MGNSCYLFLPKSYFSRSPWYHHSFQPLPSWQVWEYQSPLCCVQVCFQLPPSGPWGVGIIHPGYHSSAAHSRQRFYQDLSWLICIQSVNKIWNILFICPEQFNFHIWNCHFVDSLLPAMNDVIPPLRSQVISHLPSYFADMGSRAVCLFFFSFSFFLTFFFIWHTFFLWLLIRLLSETPGFLCSNYPLNASISFNNQCPYVRRKGQERLWNSKTWHTVISEDQNCSVYL